jgi:thiamine transporter ThiT
MLDQGIPHHPRLMMILMGGAIGVVSGVIIGLLSLVAGKFIRGDNRTVMGQNA